MEVVCVLNTMYVVFDQLCEKHHVYKVQTIGDAYMALAGAPVTTPHHAEYMTDFAFSIIDAISKIHDPSTQQPLQIRVGIHSGTVVAGVVGSTIYRYDVFGDSVNTAARMEATGLPMKIHISKATADLLVGTPFIIQERGEFEVKGKGKMMTYWVLEKKETHSSQDEPLNPFQKSKLHSQTSPLMNEVSHRKLSAPPTSTPYKDSSIFGHDTKLPHINDTPRPSLSPEAWPALEQSLAGICEEDNKLPLATGICNSVPLTATGSTNHVLGYRQSTGSVASGIVMNNHRDSTVPLDMVKPAPINIPDELKSLASENMATLKEFEKLAEVNAQNARQLANWAHYIASTIERNKDTIVHSPAPLETHRRATVASITPLDDKRTTGDTLTTTGTPVDKEDYNNEHSSKCTLL
jgi:hypothetical protein